jgi:hypothetical protein
VVTDERDGRPLRRVMIALNGSALTTTRNAATDENGRFRFVALPIAQYTVTALKPGYVQTFYGSRRPGLGPGLPVALSAASPSATLAIKLPYGAVITGTVTDGHGRPAQNVRITLLQYRMQLGERQLAPASLSTVNLMTTDDRGIYRIFGLAAGDYLLGAVPQATDVHLVTAAELQRAEQLIQQTPSRLPAGTPAPVPPPPPDTVESVGYARVFFPGTADPAGASTITLRSGEERAGVDFAMQYVRTAKISGVTLDATGQPSQLAQLTMTQPGLPSTMSSWGVSRTGQGGFTVTGVPPGDYTITARVTGGPGSGTGGQLGGFSAGGPLDVLWASANVRVDGQDVGGLMLNLQPGMTAAGRAVFESAPAVVPANLARMRMQLTPVTTSSSVPGSAVPVVAEAADDGTFSMRGILPGMYRFMASNPPAAEPPSGGGMAAPGPAWIVKSVIAGARDLTDRVFELKPGEPLNNIVITFSDRPSGISGKLLDASGQPALGLNVIVFTADRTFWGLQSRRTVTMRPLANGEFRFPSLLPGEYYISAVTDYDPADSADPTFYDALVTASLRLTLGVGDQKVQDLKLATQ